jgi:hypothetical protein
MNNLFEKLAILRPFRWFILVSGLLIGFMSYADYTGMRLLTFNSAQRWTAGGPGYHK